MGAIFGIAALRKAAPALCLLLAIGGEFAVNALGADDDKKGPSVTQKSFGKTPDGAETTLFTCTNAMGVTMQVTDYGARLVALDVPDRNGKPANVTLGFDSAEKYGVHSAFFGCTTGRFANRIARGRFMLDGKEYKLATNNGANHLHGGIKGFDKYVWKGEPVRAQDGAGAKFTFCSKDGDEGFPGTLDVTVTFLLTDANEVRIEYSARTIDKPTILNLTNHAYWNLAGAGSGDILGHKLFIAADDYLAVDAGLIPTGKLVPVKGTALDFTEPREIGAWIAETKKDVAPPGGYDHCYVLRGSKGELTLAGRVQEAGSGRVMEVYTTEPAMQFYTANYLDGDSKNGGHRQHWAFCLETQHYPDSPNHPEFPTTVLRPGQTYTQTTVYKFLVK
ncbi:MAG: aldose epimerase family protein [Deltaproteobacteria bacterium]